MNALRVAVLVFAVMTLVGIILFARAVPGLGQRQSKYLAGLKKFVRTHESVLTNHAERVLAGELKVEPPASPALRLRITDLTVDSNRNVYFILGKDSWTHFNVGLVYNAEGKPLLGDWQERTIVTNIPIKGKLFYYKTRQGNPGRFAGAT